MSTITNPPTNTAVEKLPPVPLTIEGASVLHQMLRVRWSAWKALAKEHRSEIVEGASGVLPDKEKNSSGPSAAFSRLGHNRDLLLVHVRRSFDDFKQMELRLWWL